MFQSIFDSEKWDAEALLELMCQPTVEIAEKATASNSRNMVWRSPYLAFSSGVMSYCGMKFRPVSNHVDYMLVQYDTVNYARKNDILVGCGRGSAGGCLVSSGVMSYCGMKFRPVSNRAVAFSAISTVGWHISSKRPQYDMTPEEKAKYGDRHTMFLELLEEGFQKLVPKQPPAEPRPQPTRISFFRA